jgi:hypothetical protein
MNNKTIKIKRKHSRNKISRARGMRRRDQAWEMFLC